MKETVEELTNQIAGTLNGWGNILPYRRQLLAREILAISLDQTRDDCSHCEGTGFIGGPGINDKCEKCDGTGKIGDWHPERLVVLDKDQDCGELVERLCHCATSVDMKRVLFMANFRRIKEER